MVELTEQLRRRWRTVGLLPATAGIAAVAIAGSLVVVGVRYSRYDVSGDRISANLAADMLNEVPAHGILFVSGDNADEPVLYANTVQKVRPDVTVVITPILAAPWYRNVLASLHRIKVPDVHTLSPLSLVTANPNRPAAFFGGGNVTSLKGKYYLYQTGLISQLEPESANIATQTQQQQITAAMAKWHLPNWRDAKPDSFESSDVSDYANVPFALGTTFATAARQEPSQASTLRATAVTWDKRALAIDPGAAYIRKALKQLEAS